MDEWPLHLEWMKILNTKPITTSCLSPIQQRPFITCHHNVRLVTSWPKRTLVKWKQRLVEFVPFSIALFFRWFHQIAALHFLAMDLLLLGCQLSKFSVNWKICFLQIAIACPNSSRFTLYLLNKCRLQSPQSLWSFSCRNNVIDLLFEPLSLALSVQINLMPLLCEMIYYH